MKAPPVPGRHGNEIQCLAIDKARLALRPFMHPPFQSDGWQSCTSATKELKQPLGYAGFSGETAEPPAPRGRPWGHLPVTWNERRQPQGGENRAGSLPLYRRCWLRPPLAAPSAPPATPPRTSSMQPLAADIVLQQWPKLFRNRSIVQKFDCVSRGDK
ncbi:hypothetical protein BRADI_5g10135v3 [Brachypodium distachyon]|uniref:Uncharacterized protein n=1 Tax=Brachypodium distachyon TaxID=15368 RepID=A0A2K2CGD3_BRADI|nr:hypothetical protein BRADI_5g10135v3 [Brachypodium distachyon]